DRHVGHASREDDEHLLHSIVDVCGRHAQAAQRPPSEVEVRIDDLAEPRRAIQHERLYAGRREGDSLLGKGGRRIAHPPSMAEKRESDQRGSSTPTVSSQPSNGGSVMVTCGRSKM